MREVVTFDAYGTLVDFNLHPATREILSDRFDLDGLNVEEFLDDFRVMRFQAVLGSYRPYGEVLRSSLEIAMRLHGLEYREPDGDALVAAVPEFGPFPEVPDALRALKQRYEIAIISNTDDALIARNIELIGVEFDHVITGSTTTSRPVTWDCAVGCGSTGTGCAAARTTSRMTRCPT